MLNRAAEYDPPSPALQFRPRLLRSLNNSVIPLIDEKGAVDCPGGKPVSLQFLQRIPVNIVGIHAVVNVGKKPLTQPLYQVDACYRRVKMMVEALSARPPRSSREPQQKRPILGTDTKPGQHSFVRVSPEMMALVDQYDVIQRQFNMSCLPARDGVA